MTVGELLDLLGGLDVDTEVRLAAWAFATFEYTIGMPAIVEIDGQEVLYLSEGSQTGYLPEEAFKELGWN